MKRKSFDHWPCSIARTVDLVGDAWTLLILRELFYGETRFDGFVSSLGIPRNTLTDRLSLLVDHEMLERRPYQSDPVRYEYLPSEKGHDFFGVLVAINAWGDRWLSTEAGAPLTMRHTPCGHDLAPRVVCARCGDPVRHEDVTVAPGPGYPTRLAADPAVMGRFANTSRRD